MVSKPFAGGSIRTWEGKHQSQPGRLRYFLNRMPSRPPKQQAYRKFSYYYRSKSSFLGKIFQKNDAQVSGLESLSHF
jgi:hypothetical protein